MQDGNREREEAPDYMLNGHTRPIRIWLARASTIRLCPSTSPEGASYVSLLSSLWSPILSIVWLRRRHRRRSFVVKHRFTGMGTCKWPGQLLWG